MACQLIFLIKLLIITNLLNPIDATECTECGQFMPDPYDCAAYYVCGTDVHGNLVKYAWSCELIGTKFDPARNICTSDPIPCNATPLVPPKCKCDSNSAEDPMDPTRYYVCVIASNSMLVKKHRKCPLDFVYDPVKMLCNCNESNGLPCTPDLINGGPPDDCIEADNLPDQPFYYDTPCTKTGVFADAFDCARYYTCVLNDCGEFVRYTTVCAGANSKFCPIDKVCSINNDVKCLCTTRENNFTCTQPGQFPDAACPNQYHNCLNLNVTTLITRRLVCPGGSLYDAKGQICTDELPCNKDDSGSSSSSSSGSSSSEESSEEDLCKGLTGGFAVAGDMRCYYKCIKGVLVKEKCKENEIFNYRTQKCECKEEYEKKYGKQNKRIINNINVNIVNDM